MKESDQSALGPLSIIGHFTKTFMRMSLIMLAGTGIVLILILIAYALDRDHRQSIPIVLPTYEPPVAQRLCAEFDPASQTDFCRNTTPQNADTLQIFLKGIFPEGANYADVMSRFGSITSDATCDDITYWCTFPIRSTATTIYIYVEFNQTDHQVLQFHVARPSDS